MSLLGTIYRAQLHGRQWLQGQLHRQLCRSPLRFDSARPPERALIVISGLIGDSVMSTPVILEARRHWPGARITVLGRPHNVALLSACPGIDEFHATTAEPFRLRDRRGMTELEAWLIRQKFDVALIALGDHYAVALARAKIPIRVGVFGHRLAPCLSHAYDIGSPRTWGPGERLGALRALGLEVRDVPPRLSVSEELRSSGRQQLLRLGLAPEEPYVLIHPFGSTSAQWWPAERVDELARGLRRMYGLASVLIGGAETRAAAIGNADAVIDSRGVLSLEELLGVIDQADLVISTDSGPFHIAGALGRPLVGLFRARRPEHASRYPGARVVFGQHASCESRCAWDRCHGKPCRQMDALSLDEVLTAARGFILEGSSR